MDRLYSILEEAQSVLNETDVACQPMMDNDGLGFGGLGFGSLPPAIPLKSKKVAAKRRTWKKPKDKPKRPLSAYNLFFQNERKRIIDNLPEDESVAADGMTEDERRRKHRKTHGKIGFADLARSIAKKWKTIDDIDREEFITRAEIEKKRYMKELEEWKKAVKDVPSQDPEETPDDDDSLYDDEEEEKPKPTKKKKASPPVPKRNLLPIPKVSPIPESSKPEALSSILTANVSAQQAQLLQLMASAQALTTQLRQQQQEQLQYRQEQQSSMYLDSFSASCYDNQMQTSQFNNFQPRHISDGYHAANNNNNMFLLQQRLQPNMCHSNNVVDLTVSPNSTPMRRAPVETFHRDIFDFHLPVVQDAFSVSVDDEDEEPVDDDIHLLMNDFDSEVLM